MPYRIVKIARGREQVVDAGDRRRMQARLKELRASTRGGRISGQGRKSYPVTYEIREDGDGN